NALFAARGGRELLVLLSVLRREMPSVATGIYLQHKQLARRLFAYDVDALQGDGGHCRVGTPRQLQHVRVVGPMALTKESIGCNFCVEQHFIRSIERRSRVG